VSLFAELKRRNVYRAAVFYAASAWLLVQVATQVFPFFHIDEWVVRWIVVAVGIGFPFALLFSWFYEWTPEGLRRESEVDRDKSIVRATGKMFDRWIIAVLGVAVVLLLAERFVLHKDVAAIADKSIAVLPLVNESGDPGNEYFSDGLSEELIAALARIDGLKVIGRSSSFRFKGKGEDNKAIGEQLGVATLLEGTVRRQNDRVRIVAGLVNAADGLELWSQTYDRELKDIFAVQSEIAQAVADSLKVKLLGADAKGGLRMSTTSMGAHNAYLQGHAYLELRNVEGFRRALGFFDEAIRLDPNYALAYAERAETWSWLADQTGEEMASRRASGRRDAEMAVKLNPDLAEAHTALGWVRYFDEWKFSDAVSELRRAEQLAPGSAKPKTVLAQVLDSTGQTQAAHAIALQAVDLEPLYFYAHSILARNLLHAGEFDAAEAEARKAAELQPGAARSHVDQVVVAVLRGDGEGALREAQLEPADTYRRFALALAHQVRGDSAAADAALAEVIAKDSDAASYQIAEIYALRGETDSAFQWLQRCYDVRDTGLLSILIDPLLRGLHSDPRFAAMLGKLGLSLPAPTR
jgi:TolB-like protein/Tfp pilus assembly protein PilF